MTATITEARDEMFAVFRTAWLGDPASASVPVMWPDVAAQKPPTSGAWARVTVQHNTGRQATLSNGVGQRRFRRTGVVTVQVFAPTGDGQEFSDQLATIAKNAFEGVTTSPGRVMFRDVRLREVGQDGNFYQVNVLADFEYDEVR